MKKTARKRINLLIFKRILLFIVFQNVSAQTLANTDIDLDPEVSTAKLFLLEHAKYLGDEVKVSVNSSSANLPLCKKPEAFLPNNSQLKPGRVTVGIYCNGRNKLARYLQAYISVMGSYFSTTQFVQPGTTITAALIKEQRGDLAALPNNALTSLAGALGKNATRRLKPDTILLEQHLATPLAIKRGEDVDIESNGRSFTISRQGEALETGGIGDTIRVRVSRKETLVARILGPGRVTVLR